MHRNQLEKNWHQLKKSVQEKWNKLTDADLDQIQGKFDQFIHKLQQKYGYSKEQVEKEFENWMPEKKSPGMERSEPKQAGSLWEKKGGHEAPRESHEKKPFEKGGSQPQRESHEKKPFEKGRSEDENEWKKKRKAG